MVQVIHEGSNVVKGGLREPHGAVSGILLPPMGSCKSKG